MYECAVEAPGRSALTVAAQVGLYEQTTIGGPMRVRILIVITVTTALFAAATATADKGTKNNGLSYCEENYLDLYQQVQPDGPNIVKDGLPDGSEASDDRVCRKVDILVDMRADIQQAEIAQAQSTSATTEAPVVTSSASGTDAIPSYISQCESGGDYSAVNSSSGAYGKYQIMPSTAAAYGCDLATPAGQDACAAAIYSDVGTSAWSCG